ncbi:MAG: ATP-grasp domain-containing protein [bacterium]|nr:ATP-grasp domain-containing protein [bacterium]
MRPLSVAVTGMSAADNPAPGVSVIRALRHGADDGRLRIIGLSYDPLDPGNYLPGIADHVFLTPYPSQGTEVVFETLTRIHEHLPIDVLLPTLDAELPAILKLLPRLHALGIRTFLPREQALRLRSKARLGELRDTLGIRVPKSVALSDSRGVGELEHEFHFPVVVKGQFYEAHYACSPPEVESLFRSLRGRWGLPVIVQEFIAGEEYDVAAIGDGDGGLVGAVAMRKMQLTDKGKAWGGVTVSSSELSAFVAEVIAKLRWRGPCELEVMKSQADSRFYLIEINPRFPAWIYLSVGAGRNLPWAAVRLALGEEVPAMPPAEAGVMFLRHSCDQICNLADYETLMTRGELSASPAAALWEENRHEPATL